MCSRARLFLNYTKNIFQLSNSQFYSTLTTTNGIPSLLFVCRFNWIIQQLSILMELRKNKFFRFFSIWRFVNKQISWSLAHLSWETRAKIRLTGHTHYTLTQAQWVKHSYLCTIRSFGFICSWLPRPNAAKGCNKMFSRVWPTKV